MTQRYAHLAPEHKAAAVAKLVSADALPSSVVPLRASGTNE